MKQYSHNYTMVSEAESLLYRATRLLANDCPDAAVERINEARQLLQEYLSADNMVEDDDVADGWVKSSDTFNDEQLDIINKCQRNLDCPEFDSVAQFTSNQSGLWTEIE